MASPAEDSNASNHNDYVYSCVACPRPDSADNVVQCDQCDSWWHYSCAGVTDSISTRNWTCPRCLPMPLRASSTSSRMTSASRRAILQLELQHLAEKQEFEKKQSNLEVEKRYLEKRCQLLEATLADVEGEDDRRSVRDRVDEIESREHAQSIASWVSAQAQLIPGAKDKNETGEETRAVLSAPHTPGTAKLSLEALSTALNQCVQAQVPTKAQLQQLKQLVNQHRGQDRAIPGPSSWNPGALQQQLLKPTLQAKPSVTQPKVQNAPPTDPSVPVQSTPKSSPQRIPLPAPCPQPAPLPLPEPAPQVPLPGPFPPQPAPAPWPQPAPLLLPEPAPRVEPTPAQLSGPFPPQPAPAPCLLPAPLPLPEPALQVEPAPAPLSGPFPAQPAPAPWPQPAPQTQPAPVPWPQHHLAPMPWPQPAPAPIPIIRPTPEQLAARQVIPRDLPDFNGDPEEWPIFVNSFNYSTQSCGYNHAENLARLRSCLKGHAYSSVRHILATPESVPEVMHTLQIMYGRPEILINKLIKNVRECPTPKADKLESLLEFGITVRNLTHHLIAAGHHAHLMNPILLQEIVEKLPATVKLQWAQHLQTGTEPTLRTLSEFLSATMDSISKVCPLFGAHSRAKDKSCHYAHTEGSVNFVAKDNLAKREAGGSGKPCPVCEEDGHRVKDCEKFQNYNVENRWKTVNNLKLCRTCLYFHGRRTCRSSNRCGINGCEYRHHPLLHTDSNKARVDVAPVNHTYHHCGQSILFRIVPVTLYGAHTSINTFAFLDDGSGTTLIERELAEELGVKGPVLPLCLRWTANMTRTEEESEIISLEVSEIDKNRRFLLEGARTVQNLNLAPQTLRMEELKEKFPHLANLPIRSYESAVPRLMIGLRNLSLAVPQKTKEGEYGPIAVKTRLGWCIYGCFERDAANAHQVNYHVCDCNVDDKMDDQLKEFFTREDIVSAPLEPTEVVRAKEILQRTTRKVGSHYQAGLLWRYDQVELPDSFPMALRRLECLERRMARDESLKENVHRQVKEYQAKGYAHRATPEELSEADPRRIWYLPLGAVKNPKKPAKVRLVWDAAAKVSGTSLNSVLVSGPDFLTPLPFVLFRFRMFPFAVTSDVREMFHQIKIAPEDRHSQRFLFRDHPSKAPEVFLMDVATFGATCSPTTAQFVKNENAREYQSQYPRAADGILNSHYVDDYLDSFPTLDEAKSVAEEVRFIHSQGGFQLHNWASNCQPILEHLGEKPQIESKELALSKTNNSERVLGMQWLTEMDVLSFSVSFVAEIRTLIETGGRPTKRQMLKCIMCIFDPLGLLASFLIHGKVLMQDVWRTGIQWDEQVNDMIYEQWLRWTNLFEQINRIQIPRRYFQGADPDLYRSLQVHVYVDASETAYSASVYFRVLRSDGTPQCVLVAAKTKVAPLKYHSIPRLELMSAVLGARLLAAVLRGHHLSNVPCTLWTDSKTVLAWIRSDHRRYSQFVACRVGEILTLSKVTQWRWVPSKLNVADEATKWGKGPCFDSNSRWFLGPEFLYLPESYWPQDSGYQFETIEELRPCYLHQIVCQEPVFNYQRFSNWNRLVRAVVYMKRFADRQMRKLIRLGAWNINPTHEELQEAERFIWKQVQAESYPDEVTVLTRNKDKLLREGDLLPTTSELYKLTPFLDEFGVLRIDGRTSAAKASPVGLKYPVILPKKHPVTRLLVHHYHKEHQHGNGETVVNELRQQFYIPHLRVLVRKVSSSCQWCRVYKALPQTPRMAPLPEARLSPFIRPFSYVGLDYFGPILVKLGRANAKRWIALFTCLTTRAVHVEVVFDLTTRSCISSIRRFVCRRGAPIEIHSDNATTFAGADAILKKQIEEINSETAATFTNARTKWVFIPPSSPHMGGAWERLVRSIKTAMLSLPQVRKLDEEALQTVVVEAESIVNSRPLTYLPLDSEEQEALTPNHFLLYSSSGIKQPAVSMSESPKEAIRTCELIQRNLDHFWTRWTQEYLPTLTRRTKWFGETRPVAVGDLVIIIDESRRNGWIRGRVMEVLPGKDGRIRRAVVQTANGFLRRPVSKLAVLDINADGKADPGTHLYGEGDVAKAP